MTTEPKTSPVLSGTPAAAAGSAPSHAAHPSTAVALAAAACDASRSYTLLLVVVML